MMTLTNRNSLPTMPIEFHHSTWASRGTGRSPRSKSLTLRQNSRSYLYKNDRMMQRKSLTSRQTSKRKMAQKQETSKDLEEEVDETTEKLPPLLLWRRMAKLVQLLVGVCITLRSYAIEAGFLENYMVNVVRSKGKKGDEMEDLSFNLKDFKIKKEMNVAQSAVDVLEKFPEHRTDADVTTIHHVMMAVTSFKKYTPPMQQLLCKIVRYMKCGKRRVVLRKGHIGYSLYFIYSGSVSVVLDKDDGNVFVKPEVVILRKGACFGEIALVQNTRRNATIVCAEDCEFLVVDKEDFIENKLNVQMQQELQERFNIFRAWSPFEHWTDEEILDLSYISRMEEFKHNRVVVRDSRKNEWLWFIIKGCCDILRLVDLDKSEEFRQTQMAGEQTHQYIFNNKKKKQDLAPIRQALRSTSTSDQSDSSLSEAISATVIVNEALSIPPIVNGSIKEKHTPRLQTINYESESDSDDDMFKGAKVHDPAADDEEKKKLFSDIGSGIFVKVDTLRDGQCFGLESLFDVPVPMSLVSQGCEVIHIPRNKFKEIADDKTLEGIKKLLRTYPSDEELTHKFLEESRWDDFKHDVISDVMYAHQSGNTLFENSLRPTKTSDVNNRVKSTDSRNYKITEQRPRNSSINKRLQDVRKRSKSPVLPLETEPSAYSVVSNEHIVTQMPRKRLLRPKTCPPRMRAAEYPINPRLTQLRNFMQKNVDYKKLGVPIPKPRPLSGGEYRPPHYVVNGHSKVK